MTLSHRRTEISRIWRDEGRRGTWITDGSCLSVTGDGHFTIFTKGDVNTPEDGVPVLRVSLSVRALTVSPHA